MTDRPAHRAPAFPAGTFRPDPAPAGRGRMLAAAAGLELRITSRNGEQLLLAVVIPVAALLLLSLTRIVSLPDPRVSAVVPGVLTLAVLSAGFTSQAITTGFDRRYGVLKRLSAAGMGRGLLLSGKVAATSAVVVGQVVVLVAVASALGWRPHGDLLWAVLLLALGVAAFVGLALLLGGVLRAEAVLALANLVWLLLVAVGGVVQPLTAAPAWLRTVGELTPAGALSQGLRAVLQDGHAPGALPVVVLLSWTVLGWAGVVRWFRWQ
ncbi:ABC transporter permease [Nakamurella endophytica]|uniref:ABC transporter, permease n=1 Tax=Nakamurella endophytica TaxID=1748367 RepID=A0A917STC2_9ACTN|nr:ABC transporter permease [Nakamurella endophytica]GGL93954.1 putative ABC transporter, permease [Nakamurella endophytica]